MAALRIILLLGAAAVALVSPAWATQVVLSPPGAEGWRPFDFPQVKRHTTYSVVHAGGMSAVEARSVCSASALLLPAGNVDVAATPRLCWRWRITQGLRVPDERRKAGDDFAARVYVLFRFDAAHTSVWARLRHLLESRLYGTPIPGNALTYVWSSAQPAGTRWDSPYSAAVQVVSLGAGPLPQWTDECADVTADYRSAFGHAPPPLEAIAIMTDSDNTCQRATAYYADFRFVSP